jgi:hypothetical protein
MWALIVTPISRPFESELHQIVPGVLPLQFVKRRRSNSMQSNVLIMDQAL